MRCAGWRGQAPPTAVTTRQRRSVVTAERWCLCIRHSNQLSQRQSTRCSCLRHRSVSTRATTAAAAMVRASSLLAAALARLSPPRCPQRHWHGSVRRRRLLRGGAAVVLTPLRSMCMPHSNASAQGLPFCGPAQRAACGCRGRSAEAFFALNVFVRSALPQPVPPELNH